MNTVVGHNRRFQNGFFMTSQAECQNILVSQLSLFIETIAVFKKTFTPEMRFFLISDNSLPFY